MYHNITSNNLKKKIQPNVAIYIIPNHPVWPFIKRPTKLCFHFMGKLWRSKLKFSKYIYIPDPDWLVAEIFQSEFYMLKVDTLLYSSSW